MKPRDYITRLEQYISKASFSAESDRNSAMLCLHVIAEHIGTTSRDMKEVFEAGECGDWQSARKILIAHQLTESGYVPVELLPSNGDAK